MKMTKESLLKIIGAADEVISALAGTNDEVHKDDTDKMVRLWDGLNDKYAPPEVVRELARMALAAMDSEPHPDDELSNLLWYSQEATCHSDPNYYCEFQRLATPGFIAGIILELQERRKAEMNSEPVAEVVSIYGDPEAFGEREIRPLVGIQQMTYGTKLYRHAQPAPERDQVRSEHAEWSQATFGNVGPVGPLKHLSKEALEAAAEPGDLSEWADMQFLLRDAQRRAGITDEQITQAMIEKLAVNKQREWPVPKDGEPRLHIKAQPAPVVLKDHQIRELVNQLRDIAIKYHAAGQLREQIARVVRAAMLQAGNSPVIPEGYVMVPKEPTAEMIAAAMNCDDVEFNSDETFCVNFDNIYTAMIAAAPQEVKGE